MSTKDFSSLQEKRVAEYLGWNVVCGSGARPCRPGDIESDEWLGECKTHQSCNQPIKFMASHWAKLCDEAMAVHKFPVLIVDDGSQKIDNTWCLFNLKTNPTSEIKFDAYPDRVGKNISFSNTTMKLHIINNEIDGLKLINQKNVFGIVPLKIFAEVFGENA